MNNIKEAAARLLALEAYYESGCKTPDPYKPDDGKKHDSAGRMRAFCADVRAVCGELAALREDKARLDSGCILIVTADSKTLHTKLDLRAAIAAARNAVENKEGDSK